MKDAIGARLALGVLGVCAVITVTGTAAAEEFSAAEFGAPGTVAISGSLQGSYLKSDENGMAFTSTSLGAWTSVDVFAARRFSVGVAGSVSRWKASTTINGEDGGSSRSVMAGAALRLGYYVPLGERVGFWPMLSAGASHIDFRQNGSEQLDAHIEDVKLLANLVFHVDRGWYLTVTPGFVAYQRSNIPGNVGLGAPNISIGFGGYF